MLQLLQGDELRELIKGFLAKLEMDGPTPLPSVDPTAHDDSSGSNDKFLWLKVLRWCPRELLDLVNSKACRGRGYKHRFQISV
jgi:DNA mismatch repair protein MLH3